jgi:hypothetical protein
MGSAGGLDGSQQPGRWTERRLSVLLSRLHLITLCYVFLCELEPGWTTEKLKFRLLAGVQSGSGALPVSCPLLFRHDRSGRRVKLTACLYLVRRQKCVELHFDFPTRLDGVVLN